MRSRKLEQGGAPRDPERPEGWLIRGGSVHALERRSRRHTHLKHICMIVGYEPAARGTVWAESSEQN